MEVCCEHVVFVALRVCGTCVQCTQTAAMTENFLCGLLIRVQCGAEILLLLLDVIKRLVDVILFPFCRQDMAIKSGQIVAIFDQGPVPNCYFPCKLVELPDMSLEFAGPLVDDFFDGFPSEHRRWRDSDDRACGC